MSDEKLRLALEEYDEVILASLPEPSECTHKFSPRFERKMRILCRRAKHPVAYKTLQRVACVLLALLALFGSIMAFNAEARAAVLDWIKETFGQGVRYSYQGEEPPATEERNRYELGWMPGGYTLEYSYADELSTVTVYTQKPDKMLILYCIYNVKEYRTEDAVSLYIDISRCDKKTATLNNGTADIYIERRAGENSGIVWGNEEGTVLFYITAPCNEQEMIKMAENIVKKSFE